MRTRTAGALFAGLVIGLAPVAAASAAPSAPGLHGQTECTFTVHGPAYLWDAPSYRSTIIGGKHTGDVVTSPDTCTYYYEGFHSVTRSNGTVAFIFASNLVHPAPALHNVSTWTLTSTAHVLDGPNSGNILGTKTAGQTVTSPLPKNYDNGGNYDYVEVILATGNVGWIYASHLS